MANPPTRPSLIARLSSADDTEAWQTFVAIYEPMLVRLSRRWGLQEADSREVVQEVLTAVAESIDRYEPRGHSGAFRGWLAAITRHKMADLMTARSRFPSSGGGSDFHAWIAEQPQDAPQRGLESRSRWDIEQRRAVFAWAADRVRKQVQQRTWVAFYRTAVLGEAASTVAADLDANVGWVYVARSRVFARLRKTVAQWDDATESGVE